MASNFDNSTLEKIKSSVDIVELISSYFPLKNNNNNYIALCPFHNEKTPSLHINQTKQFFYCFGCHESGDGIAFVQKYENLSFQDAVRHIANRYNIPLETNSTNQQKFSKKNFLYQLLDKVFLYYKEQLNHNQTAQEYLIKRKIAPYFQQQFKIGFAPDSWDDIITWGKKNNYSNEDLIQAGLLIKKDNKIYNRFRNRLMFSITNDEGKIVGFSGRILTDDKKSAKYINSPESIIFHKSDILYGLSLARKNIPKFDNIILCEGQIDVIACHQAELNNAVSSQGTALTKEHIYKLKRYNNNIILAFDGDKAGKKASLKSLDIFLEHEMNVKIVAIQDGMDPDTLIQNNGKEYFQNLIATAQDFFLKHLADLKQEIGTENPISRNKIAEEMLILANKVKNELMKYDYIHLLSQDLALDEQALLHKAKQLQKNPLLPAEEKQISIEKFSESEVTLLELLLISEEFSKKIIPQIPIDNLQNNKLTNIILEIIDCYNNDKIDNLNNEITLKIQNSIPSLLPRIMNPVFSHENSQEQLQKALSQCLHHINATNINEQIAEIKFKLSQEISAEEKKLLLQQFLILQQQHKKLQQ